MMARDHEMTGTTAALCWSRARGWISPRFTRGTKPCLRNLRRIDRRSRLHAQPSRSRAWHALIPAIVWLSYYQENTPGVQALDNASTALYSMGEPQPDALLRYPPRIGGTYANREASCGGVPELIVEVSHASRFTDLGPKFDDYERVGVLEYIVLAP